MDFHHPLLVEFAEYRDLILQLKSEREDFCRVFDEYHAIDRRICRVERGFEIAPLEELETLKKRRLWLKDQIYSEIRSAAPPTVGANGLNG
jgi:uncharacterized protein YdcH (DUF465 family)